MAEAEKEKKPKKLHGEASLRFAPMSVSGTGSVEVSGQASLSFSPMRVSVSGVSHPPVFFAPLSKEAMELARPRTRRAVQPIVRVAPKRPKRWSQRRNRG